MNAEHDKALCERFPKLYADRNGDMRATCMVWGFSCGDGWFQIVWDLSEKIEAALKCLDVERGTPETTNATKHPKQSAAEAFRVVQVKEKFGGLRFYTNYHTDEIGKLIGDAERLSYKTCEVCGQPGVLRGSHWLFTACDEHSKGEKPREDEEEFSGGPDIGMTGGKRIDEPAKP